MARQVLSNFRPPEHDHARCVSDALARAECVCAARGARLTAVRRRVLELLWQAHRPMPAYGLLERLREGRPGAAPPTVYRALEFLQAHGLVHRIESLNAYVGCGDPSHPHSGQFLICDRCRSVAEMDDPDIGALIEARARAAGFRCDGQTVEIRGRCPRCAVPPGAAP